MLNIDQIVRVVYSRQHETTDALLLAAICLLLYDIYYEWK